MNENMNDDCRKPELEAFLRSRIEEAGGITFSEYMEHCLYHPRSGYYMGPRTRIGKEGDFFTSSSVHSLFGRLISRQLRQMWKILGQRSFTVAEQGAGEGHLCLDILNAAEEEAPDFYRDLRFRLVEISPDNRRRQEKLLSGHKQKVEWCSLEDLNGVEGCFLSNELIDAFPVHVVENREGELQEVFVVFRDGVLAEALRPLSTPEIREYFLSLGIQPAPGNRAEVNLEAPRWMKKVAGLLRRGFIMTIDYGYPAQELYAPFRRSGTLMCYYRHTANEDPLQHPGCQDITAHVDFTTLQRAGESGGLQTLFFGEQYRFLLGLGFVETLAEMQEREPDEHRARTLRLVLKNLILPEGGMGETFKVLVQGKGVGLPELLCNRGIGEICLPGIGM
jgi:SAM-dependent MidA family methyltransferase